MGVTETVDRETLSEVTHRLVLQMRDGRRRELFMTHSLDAAVESASRIVEFHDGVVLVEEIFSPLIIINSMRHRKIETSGRRGWLVWLRRRITAAFNKPLG